MIVNQKTVLKLERLVKIYGSLVFRTIADVSLEYGETEQHLRRCPGDDFPWQPASPGLRWGGAWKSMWLRGQFQVPQDFTDQRLYIQADTGAVETLLIVDGQYKGLFNIETEEGVRGHHHTRLAIENPKPGSSHTVSLECYAGHPCVGTMPFDDREARAADSVTYDRTLSFVRICCKDDLTASFVTELRILLQIAAATGPDSFRGAGIYRSLQQVFGSVPQQPSDYSSEEIARILTDAREVMKPLLEMRNGDSAPRAGIIGHSHIDTAWLWTVDETKRKCARTFSNTLNLMDEFPDYKFLQSVPLHLEMMRSEYPEIFKAIQQRIADGRWEPNGGSWVEPDCNIPGGESLTRQFLYGQAYTQEHFGRRSDQFWMPDVFGYSAAIPQILKQCGISGFLTTKLSWNEENRFPYDSFWWSGIDGTRVLTHFNTTHCWPDPESLIAQTDEIQHKDVQDTRLCAFGYGDGGGGPLAEMLETAPYLKDIEGVPRTEYTTLSSFMDRLAESPGLPVWTGELYLELHRGTLTSQHNLKKLNRKLENLLRETEYLYSLSWLDGSEYPADEFRKLWKVLLKNQFHDILPGTSIGEVNVTAIKELTTCYQDVAALLRQLDETGKTESQELSVVIENSRAWDRTHIILDGLDSQLAPASGLEWQRLQNVTGESAVMVHGCAVPGTGSRMMQLVSEPADSSQGEPFHSFDGDSVVTPHYVVKFGANGAITSLLDRSADRELVQTEGELNRLVLGEDLPALWDNWDVDVDQKWKMQTLVAQGPWVLEQQGPLQIRFSNRFQIGAESAVEQHLVLYRESRLIEFDTVVHWHEKHKLLKTMFDLAVQTDVARHEIQYGHIVRNTHENSSQDRMQFEVSNQRWTDVSEPGYGVAMLNDCKYGISARGSSLGLSLLKSGTHPDPSADEGTHSFRYALLPHHGPFSTESVVRPACEFNSPMSVKHGASDARDSFLSLSAPSVLIESIKQAEDGRGLIIRLYDAERMQVPCRVSFASAPVSVCECTMLEDECDELPLSDTGEVELSFRGFEIKTLRVVW